MTLAVLGAPMWAEWLYNPCLLGALNVGPKSEDTRAVLTIHAGAHPSRAMKYSAGVVLDIDGLSRHLSG